MKTRRRDVERPICWVIVLEIVVKRQQIHVMHRQVIEISLRHQKSNVDERSAVEPEAVDLIDDKDVVRDVLGCEEFVHVRHKLQQLLEPVAERNNQSEFLLVSTSGEERIVKFLIPFVTVD
jgi:hypothetical protein